MKKITLKNVIVWFGQVKNESDSLDIQSGVAHLKKAMHMFPNYSLIR